jgi:hypothetical protein
LDLEAVGVRRVIPEGDNLRLIPTVVIPAELLARLKAHKADLLAALRPMGQPHGDLRRGADADLPGGAGGDPGDPDHAELVDRGERGLAAEEDVIPADVPPCPRCGLLELWQTLAGDWRCLRCDPPTTAIRVLEHVQRIRQRLGMPARPETAEMLADLRRLTSTAARPRDPAAVARRGAIP